MRKIFTNNLKHIFIYFNFKSREKQREGENPRRYTFDDRSFPLSLLGEESSFVE